MATEYSKNQFQMITVHNIKLKSFFSCLEAEIGSRPEKLSPCYCFGPQLGLSNLPEKKTFTVLNV